MTWIKICGITNLEDALTSVEAGADALGFVFYEKSPRNVTPESVRAIIDRIPVHIEKIGVFVGNTPRDLPQLAHRLGLTGSQLHFGSHLGTANETIAHGLECFPPGFKKYHSLSLEVFFQSEESVNHFIANAARGAELMKSHPGAEQLRDFIGTFFLDSGSLQQPGGTGVAFDWRKAAPMVERMKQVVTVVVAGGLNPANVGEMINTLNPWGVDVSSGVESKPGKKDPAKVRAFVAAVRQAERRA